MSGIFTLLSETNLLLDPDLAVTQFSVVPPQFWPGEDPVLLVPPAGRFPPQGDAEQSWQVGQGDAAPVLQPGVVCEPLSSC